MCTNKPCKTKAFLPSFPQVTILAQTPLSCHIFTIYHSLSNLAYKLWTMTAYLGFHFSCEGPWEHVKITK